MRSLNIPKRIIAALLSAAVLISMIAPVGAFAEEQEQKTVRVGWFDSSFCYFDKFGRRCGVDYKYHQKISTYTDRTYKYFEDSWPNLLQMLKDGDIDLLSDVSYKPEREEFMYFSDLPMGTEAHYIYVSADNMTITADDPASFNGKRIGVNKDSYQESLLREWVEKTAYTPTYSNLTLIFAPKSNFSLLYFLEIRGYSCGRAPR